MILVVLRVPAIGHRLQFILYVPDFLCIFELYSREMLPCCREKNSYESLRDVILFLRKTHVIYLELPERMRHATFHAVVSWNNYRAEVQFHISQV